MSAEQPQTPPVVYRGLDAIADALRPPGVDSRGNPHPVPSIATVKRWIERPINPLPARHDNGGWYLRRVDAAVWLSQSDLPGRAYQELVKLRKLMAAQKGNSKERNQIPREISQGGRAGRPTGDRF